MCPGVGTDDEVELGVGLCSKADPEHQGLLTLERASAEASPVRTSFVCMGRSGEEKKPQPAHAMWQVVRYLAQFSQLCFSAACFINQIQRDEKGCSVGV